jgi:regulator of replication initiation timing
MNKNIKLIPAGLLVLTLFLTSGCVQPENNPEIQKKNITKRFQQPQKDESVLESAIDISEKYAKLSKEHNKLQDKYKGRVEENRILAAKNEQLKAELAQAEKELKQANELLKSTVEELNKWKKNVLGFQQEVRQADQAQLEALYKILTLMGGKPAEPNKTVQKKLDTEEPEKDSNKESTLKRSHTRG